MTLLYFLCVVHYVTLEAKGLQADYKPESYDINPATPFSSNSLRASHNFHLPVPQRTSSPTSHRLSPDSFPRDSHGNSAPPSSRSSSLTQRAPSVPDAPNETRRNPQNQRPVYFSAVMYRYLIFTGPTTKLIPLSVQPFS